MDFADEYDADMNPHRNHFEHGNAFDLQELRLLIRRDRYKDRDPYDLKALHAEMAVREAFRIGLLTWYKLDVEKDPRIHPTKREKFINDTKHRLFRAWRLD